MFSRMIQSLNCTKYVIVKDVYCMIECVRNEDEWGDIFHSLDCNLADLGLCNIALSFPTYRAAKLLYILDDTSIKCRIVKKITRFFPLAVKKYFNAYCENC